MLIFEHQDQHHGKALGRKSAWVVACQTNIMFQNSRNLILKTILAIHIHKVHHISILFITMQENANFHQ